MFLVGTVTFERSRAPVESSSGVSHSDGEVFPCGLSVSLLWSAVGTIGELKVSSIVICSSGNATRFTLQHCSSRGGAVNASV